MSFEFNTTDNDLGLQLFLDAEGRRQVKVSDPDKLKIELLGYAENGNRTIFESTFVTMP